jgi:hypothetical protein
MPAAFTCHRQANRVPVDYYTCTAVELWVSAEMKNTWDSPWYSNISPLQYTAARSLACASHNCSCSAPPLVFDHHTDSTSNFFNNTASTIAIDGHLWNLSAPVLEIGLTSAVYGPEWLRNGSKHRDPQNASDFWSDTVADAKVGHFNSLGGERYLGSEHKMYMYNDTLLAATAIVDNGRCIAEDAYSWGFSSLLLLTFCCYTSAFALALILLQTDVYWNSRHDRNYQSHSLYTDVLYLAAELKNTFGQDIEDMQSPKAFAKQVRCWKQGLRLDVGELPLSRWQEWRQSRATKRADRKVKIAPANINDPTFELRNRGGSAKSDTAYHGLIGENGDQSSFEAVSRSDRRSSSPSEEL